ncbi:MAG: hypothetical protein ABIS23_06460 [Sphingomicrobium sp.]
MAVADLPHRQEWTEQLGYWLRRAEQESIAAIRSPDSEAAQRHDAMALAYSTMAMSLMDEQPAA